MSGGYYFRIWSQKSEDSGSSRKDNKLCDFLFQDQDDRDKTKAKVEKKMEKRAMKKEFKKFFSFS